MTASAGAGRPVAVGVDGSAGGFSAVEWAAAEAASRQAPLYLVCARPPGAAEAEPWPHEQLHAAHRLAAGAYPAMKVTEDAVCEAPATALIGAAAEAEMLALGSRALPSGGFVLGPVALSVPAHASRPVVAVRGRIPTRAPSGAEPRPVVAGVDLRRGCDSVLGFAFRTAAAQHRPLRVAHARYADPAQPAARSAGGPAAPGWPGLEPQAKRELGRLLQPWRERFRDVETEIWTDDREPVPYLLEAGADAALTAVGRRIRGHPYPTRLGAVIHGLLHHSPQAVAVVPTEAAAYPEG